MNWLLPPLSPNFEAALRDVKAVRPESRMAAAERLGRPSDEQREPALRGLSCLAGDVHPGVRATALAALGAIGSEAELDVIIAALADVVPEVREFATLALAQIGGERAVACLRRELATGTPEVRFQAVAGIADLAPEQAPGWLSPLLEDEDAEVRAQVVRALGSFDQPQLVGHLAGALDDVAGDVQLEAALALARFRDPRAERPLLAALDRRERLGEVARALSQLACARAREPLAALARSWFTAPHLRAELGAALVELGDPRGTAALKSVLRGLRSDARGYAVELACEVMADGVVPDLVALVERPRGIDPASVMLALKQLAQRSPHARSALQQLARRSDSLAQAASRALGELVEETAEP